MTLSKAWQKLLTQADPGQAQLALARQQRHISKGRWLAARNRYRDYPSERVTDDLAGTSTNVNDLSGFVAASAPAHLADGWAYMGRALDAHAHNDLDASRHAAYYAELRAAISLLSTQGIGIFDKTHVALTSKGCVSLPGSATHQMVWDALVYWADNPVGAPGAAKLFGRTIQPFGVSLDEWFVGLPFGKPWKPLASRWLQGWGADLGWFAKDRKARNVASYAANQVRTPIMGPTKRTSEVLRLIWLAFEPTPGRPFHKLDLHLLRRSVEAMYKAARAGTPSPTSTAFVEMVKAVAANAPSDAQGAYIERFLLRQVDGSDLEVLSEADGRVGVYKPGHHVQVISRAAVLLRLAAGACFDLLQQSGFLVADLSQWRDAFAVDRGLWDVGNAPPDPTDLWADVQAAVQDLDMWETNSSGSPTLFDWRAKLGQAVETLTVTDRLLAWGV